MNDYCPSYCTERGRNFLKIIYTDKDFSQNSPEQIDKIIDSLFTTSRLSKREIETLKLRYGLGDGYIYTLEENGRIFNVTRERIRQIQLKALRKLEISAQKSLEGIIETS